MHTCQLYYMDVLSRSQAYGLLRCTEIASHFLITSFASVLWSVHVEETWHMLKEELIKAECVGIGRMKE